MPASAANIAKGIKQRNKLAFLVSDGLSIADAARAMGVSQPAASKHWRVIRDGLGWQAV